MKRIIKTFEHFTKVNEYISDTEVEGEVAIDKNELPILQKTHSKKEKELAVKGYLESIFDSENSNITIKSVDFTEEANNFDYFNVTVSGTHGELIKVVGTDKIIYYEW